MKKIIFIFICIFLSISAMALMDELAVWNRALSSGEVKALYLYDVTYFQPCELIIRNEKEKSMLIKTERAVLTEKFSVNKCPSWAYVLEWYEWEEIATIKIEHKGKIYIYTRLKKLEEGK